MDLVPGASGPGGGQDIDASFNTNFNWYYGTDGRPAGRPVRFRERRAARTGTRTGLRGIDEFARRHQRHLGRLQRRPDAAGNLRSVYGKRSRHSAAVVCVAVDRALRAADGPGGRRVLERRQRARVQWRVRVRGCTRRIRGRPARATSPRRGHLPGRQSEFSDDLRARRRRSDSRSGSDRARRLSRTKGGLTDPCTVTLSPPSATFPAPGGVGSVGVATSAGCTWTAVSNAPNFLTVTAGASGTGNGTVTYSVAGGAAAARSGTITIGGATLTVTQLGPVMALDRTSLDCSARRHREARSPPSPGRRRST